MFSVILGLLGGAASQPAIVRPVPPPIIMTPAPAPPRRAEIPVPATRAKANLPSYFSTADYPQAALRNDEKGFVAFAADVSPDGRVTHCVITTSSGSPSLDSTTCAIIQRRARFTPARDAAGHAVEDRITGRIRWELPPRRPIPFADLKVAMVFTVSEGVVTDCRGESSIKQPTEAPCASMMAVARKLVAEGRSTRLAFDGELVLEQGILIGGPDAASEIGRGAGETLDKLTALAIDIAADGTIKRCVPAYGNMSEERPEALCKDSSRAKFVPLETSAAERSDRHAVRYMASYIRAGS